MVFARSPKGVSRAWTQPYTPSGLIIAKNRHGETGKVALAWSPQYTTFSSLDYRHEED